MSFTPTRDAVFGLLVTVGMGWTICTEVPVTRTPHQEEGMLLPRGM